MYKNDEQATRDAELEAKYLSCLAARDEMLKESAELRDSFKRLAQRISRESAVSVSGETCSR